MLRILYASSTDTLLKHLVRSLSRPGDPARLKPVLLPSRPLVERVNLGLARETGVAMGCELLLPAAFLERVASGLKLEPLHVSWSSEGLFWRVFEALPALASRHPRRIEDACEDLRSRAALAREVADRLDQYLHFRPDLIQAWDSGLSLNEYLGRHPELKPVFSEGLAPEFLRDEAWQKDLWGVLCLSLAGHPHPAQRLDSMASLAATADLDAFQPAVEVLATGPLPFPILKMLKALGARAEVNLRVLLPANGYLADIQPRWMQLVHGEAVDLEAEGNPLVAQMGRQAVEAFNGLLQLSDGGQEFEPLEEEEGPGTSLLARIQSDVRALRQPSPQERPVEEDSSPGQGLWPSLRVHRCHGARREVEVLRDELLAAFRELEGLRPEDVLILAPDLDLYGPLSEAVLAQGSEPRLPLALAERRQEQRDPLFKALLALLGLAAGRAAVSEWLAFLDLPALRKALGEEACEGLTARLRASGITFGLDPGHRAALGAGEDPNGTWRAGLDRLLAGLWLGKEGLARDAGQAPALALSGELSGAPEALLKGLQWSEDLLATLLAWRTPAAPQVWAERLDFGVEAILRASEAGLDATNCLEAAQTLRRAGTEHACATALDAAGVLEFVESLGEDEERRVAAVGGRIALGGLKPLRALPCRVLAMVGLSDAAFPRRSQARAWDLLAALPLPGDRDPRKDDRQLFLDSLLAAKDRVILTAPVRGQHDDTLGPLSACVEELLRTALETLGCKTEERPACLAALLVDEPLQPFSPRAFDGSGGRRLSHDAASLKLAQRLNLSRGELPFAGTACRPPAAEPCADLDRLYSDLKDPAKAFLKARGVRVPGEAEDPFEADNEPVDAGQGLLKWKQEREALAAALKGKDPFLVQRMAADRLLPLGLFGRLRGQSLQDQSARLAQGLVERAGKRPHSRLTEALLADGRRVEGGLKRAQEGGPLLNWTLRGLEPKKGAWDADPRDLLEAWLGACLAAASGDFGPSLFAALSKKTREPAYLSLEAPPAETAKEALSRLLDLQAQGQRELLAFAPKTSHALAKALIEGGHKDPEEAARREWEGKDPVPGEGQLPSNALAWRGQDPLDEAGLARWKSTALQVWTPALHWWSAARSWDPQGLGPRQGTAPAGAPGTTPAPPAPAAPSQPAKARARKTRT